MNENGISEKPSAASQVDIAKTDVAQTADGVNAVTDSRQADAQQPKSRVTGKTDPELKKAALEWLQKRIDSGEACVK